jgi:hypothetical protein
VSPDIYHGLIDLLTQIISGAVSGIMVALLLDLNKKNLRFFKVNPPCVLANREKKPRRKAGLFYLLAVSACSLPDRVLLPFQFFFNGLVDKGGHFTPAKPWFTVFVQPAFLDHLIVQILGYIQGDLYNRRFRCKA